ncbi:MAG: Na(+)/H(+) antiporter subunit D [Deltaproteobacteria bacterium]|nr:MAG: Na(+)/H(+) antiporter subunit D [Deltaproteobacteria bacterium]
MNNLFLHPSLLLMTGACLLPLMRGRLRQPFLLAVPLLTLALVIFINLHPGCYGLVNFMGRWQLTFGRVDNLAMVFAGIMALMTLIGTLYGLDETRLWHHAAAWFYAAGSLGVIYSGDYLSLFLFWEMMAFASVFLVWAGREQDSLAAGFRYLLVHTFGGLLLLLGFILKYQATGSLAFVLLDENNPQLYTWLIMAGLMLNAAVVPFHSWLPDAYSKSSIAGAVFMCALTTKTAVYTLIRGFAGFDVLVILGIIMAVYGIIYALLENNVRRLLGWEIVSQVGYMVTGVGIGTALAINGTCCHAAAHILYKGLLFMGAGAVIQATGKSRLTEMGGLYQKMPGTLVFMVIGGLSVSAFPFFSGFVSKSMIITAGFEEHLYAASLILTAVSVGTFLAAGLRLPYFMFFSEAKDESLPKPAETAWNMKLAMLTAALLCLAIGTFYQPFYRLLPFQVDYHPYSPYHLSETLQLLFFTALGFYFFKDKLRPQKGALLDLDWFYRKGGQAVLWLAVHPVQRLDNLWGRLYRILGLSPLMAAARFWAWFDQKIIDRAVDGLAGLVKSTGGKIAAIFQRGQVQQTIYYSISLITLALIAYAFL